MVNHIKTLLLNLRHEDVKGVPGAFYIDPSFSGVEAGGAAKQARDRLFVGCNTVESRLCRVNTLYGVLGRLDCTEHLSLYDDRVTRLDSGTDGEDFDEEFLIEFSRDTKDYDLFHHTGFQDLDDELARLNDIKTTESDGSMCVVSRILALVAQLEALRRRQHG